MIKILRFYLFLTSLLMLSAIGAYAQNCTVNAGAPRTICPGLPFVLVGTATGAFAETAVWSQIAGPAVTVGTTIVSPEGNASATITGYVNGSSYTFRLSAKCTDGSPIFNDVIYTVSNLTVADAGVDRTECPGAITLVGNSLKPGETGTWSRVTGTAANITSQANGTANVNLPNTSAGVTTFRYTITDGTCTTTDEIVVRNLGGVPTVDAGTHLPLGCYTVTTNLQMNASYGGNGNGQIGTWSFISGPSIPNFSNPNSNTANVSNLIEGTYVLRWTVVGTCVNGTDDVTITVLPATQSVTGVSDQNLTYCDGRTSTILTGVKPLYNGETVLWELTSGQVGVNIINPTSFTTSITGLNGSGNYDFRYTITNTNTNCTSVGTYRIRYTAPPSITLTPASPQILACDASQLSIPFTTGGGNETQWALISAPAGSAVEATNSLGTYRNSNSPQLITGLDKIGTYVVRFKRFSNNSSGGCVDAFADMTIVVSKKPYVATAGTAQLLACGTLAATLAGNPPLGSDVGIGSWTQVKGPNTAVIADRFNSNTGISGLISGVYTFRWIVSGGNGNCQNTQADVDVVVASMPTTVSAGTTIAACYGTPIKLDGSIPALNEKGTWSVEGANTDNITFSNVNDPKAVAQGFQINKSYSLRWTISNNCGTIHDIVVINTDSNNGPKQAIAGADTCLPAGTTTFNLSGNAAGTGETGTWTLLPGAPAGSSFNATSNNTTVTGVTIGTYKFVWKIERGSCVPTTDTVSITISPATTVAVITGAPSQNICATSPTTSYVLNLLANQPAPLETGTWTQVEGPGGAVIHNPNSYNTANVTGLIGERYKFRWTITNNSCSSSFAEIIYNIGEGPTVADAGTNQTICDLATATLAAVAPTVGTGIWSVVSGPNSPTFASSTNPNTTIGNLILGVYTLKWTTTNGPFCASSTDNVTITVGKSANAGPDQNLCNVTSTVLVGNEGSTGTWTLVSGSPTVTPTPNSANTAIVTGMAPGSSYTFKYTITAGGCGNLSDEVNVVISSPPSTADAGPDQEICTANGSTVNLLAVTPVIGTGVWSFLSQPTGGVATIATSLTPGTAVNNLTVPGVYLLEYTITNANCSGTQSNKDIVRITVYGAPTTAAAMTAQNTACQNGVILTGTTPTVGVGTWTYVSGGTSVPVITSPNSPTTTITNLNVEPLNPYIFRWTITNGTCTPSFADVSVTVVDVSPSQAAAGPDGSTCTSAIGGTASYTLNATPAVVGTGTGTWTITGPGSPVINTPNSPTSSVSNLIKGTYTLKWTITNTSSCKTEDTMIITVFDPPTPANAGPATASYCLYSPVQLAATPTTSGIGTWTVFSKPSPATPNPVFSNVNAANATVNGLESGIYIFRWTTSNGAACATTQDDIIVTIGDCHVAIAKSAGTPVQQANGSFNVTFTFTVRNTGTADLDNVQVQDQLNLTFPSPKTFSVLANAVTTSNPVLVRNPSFNGTSDPNLLVASSSTLAAGQEVTITLIVNVTL